MKKGTRKKLARIFRNLRKDFEVLDEYEKDSGLEADGILYMLNLSERAVKGDYIGDKFVTLSRFGDAQYLPAIRGMLGCAQKLAEMKKHLPPPTRFLWKFVAHVLSDIELQARDQLEHPAEWKAFDKIMREAAERGKDSGIMDLPLPDKVEKMLKDLLDSKKFPKDIPDFLPPGFGNDIPFDLGDEGK